MRTTSLAMPDVFITALYFVGYVLWEVPANIVLKKFNPKVW